MGACCNVRRSSISSTVNLVSISSVSTIEPSQMKAVLKETSLTPSYIVCATPEKKLTENDTILSRLSKHSKKFSSTIIKL